MPHAQTRAMCYACWNLASQADSSKQSLPHKKGRSTGVVAWLRCSQWGWETGPKDPLSKYEDLLVVTMARQNPQTRTRAGLDPPGSFRVPWESRLPLQTLPSKIHQESFIPDL